MCFTVGEHRLPLESDIAQTYSRKGADKAGTKRLDDRELMEKSVKEAKQKSWSEKVENEGKKN